MKKSGKWKVQFLVMAFCVFGLVAVLVGSSYAIFSDVSDQGDYNTVTAGTLQLSYEDTQSLSLSNLYPVSDVEGMTGDGYTFTVRNIGTLPSDYKVMIQDDEAMIQADGCSDHLMPKANIKISVDGGTPFLLSSIEESNYMITTGNLQPGDSVTHVVKVWIDEASGNEILGTHFHGKVVVEGIQGEFVYRDESGANPPELVDGMIPVTHNGTNWVKADTSSKWYDYNNQEWANAVTVTEENRATYMSAEAGTVIPMDDINTMWVWIPRYEYMYTNLGDQYAGGTKEQPGEIEINFITKETTSPSSGEYKVHPAFNFGGTELSGIWVGKFETGGTLASACTNESCDISNIVIKPNVSSLRNQNVSSFFYTARSMQMNSSNPYGFRSTSGNVHMSKNSEWSSVAYLSQSKYGKYGNPNYTGANKEIYQNKSSEYITGMSNGTPSTDTVNTQVTYDTPNTGYGASTTGTIYGIYDTSGGSWEYVMGVLMDPNGNPRSGGSTTFNSGFNGALSEGTYSSGIPFPAAQYYNLYTTEDATTACSGGVCYGHALSEMAGWYQDYQSFVNQNGPWVVRGGYWGSTANAGVFHFATGRGNADTYSASRATLVLF